MRHHAYIALKDSQPDLRPPWRFWKPPHGGPVATYELRNIQGTKKRECYRPHGTGYIFDALPKAFFEKCEEITADEAFDLAPRLREYV